MLIISPFAAGTFGTGVFWNSLFSQSPCSREAKVCWGGRGGVVRVRGPWMTAGDVSACPWLICWRTSVTTFCPEVVTLGSRLCVYLMLFGFLTDDFEKMKKKIHNPKTVKKNSKLKKVIVEKRLKTFKVKNVIVLKNKKGKWQEKSFDEWYSSEYNSTAAFFSLFLSLWQLTSKRTVQSIFISATMPVHHFSIINGGCKEE